MRSTLWRLWSAKLRVGRFLSNMEKPSRTSPRQKGASLGPFYFTVGYCKAEQLCRRILVYDDWVVLEVSAFKAPHFPGLNVIIDQVVVLLYPLQTSQGIGSTEGSPSDFFPIILHYRRKIRRHNEDELSNWQPSCPSRCRRLRIFVIFSAQPIVSH